MEKKKLLFVINQFFKGGAETALLNLFHALSPEQYEIDFLVLDQIDVSGTISLLPDVPAWIRVVDVSEGEGWIAFVKKAMFRFYRNIAHRQLFRRAATAYLRDKRYDAAFSYGEWFSSRLVAEYVSARRKYVWVHADMDKADFLHPDIIRYQQCFDRFIFSSKQSMQGAEKRFSRLCENGLIIHNLVNEDQIHRLSLETLPIQIDSSLPILLTVANVRPEKNHLRQVAVMKELFEEGERFLWLNAGMLANHILAEQIKNAIRQAGLESYFFLLGAVENPYPLMRKAAAICVLSDHESWSMVITEAKVLGVPVVATKTSGALEQIIHLETGILCDFTEEDIKEKIKLILRDSACQQKIRAKLSGFSACSDTLKQLDLITTEKTSPPCK